MKRLVLIGNFDGVHLGHQAMVRDASARARGLGLTPTVLTFSPHPAAVLGRGAPSTLTRLERKRALLREVDEALDVHVVRFDAALAAMSPSEFAEAVLARELRAAEVVVGENFRFGAARAGSVADLAALGERLGFAVRSFGLVADEEGPLSSSRVRAALVAGDVRGAERVLGRPHTLLGRVERGDQRGRTLGFPTANLGGVEEALPRFGVYAVRVRRLASPGDARGTFLADGVANLGDRPTIVEEKRAPRAEAHLFDVSTDLYGEWLAVELVGFVREERRFAGLDELRAQIARDAEAARLLCAERSSRADG